jgi:carboxypeptidase Q
MSRILAISILCLALLNPLSALTQSQTQPAIDQEIQSKIRNEGMKNSRIMQTLHYFTDRYGPRLTGSPSLKAAGEWAIKQMADWGLENGHLEGWNFGHPGWANERLSAHIISPVKESLVCEVLAWTPGTNGDLKGLAFQLIPPESPTREELDLFLDQRKNRVKGKIVLVGKPATISVSFNPIAKRMDDREAKSRFSENTSISPTQTGSRRSQDQDPRQPRALSRRQVSDEVNNFLLTSGALMRINDGGREHRQIRAFSNRSFDPTKTLPTVILSNEDYGRISRILAGGTPVELEFNIVNRIFPEGRTAYNVISEIPGTDRRDEVVMLGGHLDSWHAATGATDNAIGCAIMMEAARILKAIGIKPRRTIRVALWSGEEQGLLGSKAYVKEHFGSFENPKPEFFKFGGYLNIDSGTGRARGMGVFGPPEVARRLREALAPFEDLGFSGVIAVKSRAFGGSDHTVFNNAGLPGIGVAQDTIDYLTHTWHTNLDTYERVIEEDAKKSAIVIAAATYFLSMDEQLLPRFSNAEMPPLPQTRR